MGHLLPLSLVRQIGSDWVFVGYMVVVVSILEGIVWVLSLAASLDIGMLQKVPAEQQGWVLTLQRLRKMVCRLNTKKWLKGVHWHAG